MTNFQFRLSDTRGATEADSIYRLGTAGQRLGGECRGVSHGARVTNTVTDGVVSVSNGIDIGIRPQAVSKVPQVLV